MLSDRDEFAKAALTGLLAGDVNETLPGAPVTMEQIDQARRSYAAKVARASYRYADAMVAESLARRHVECMTALAAINAEAAAGLAKGGKP